MAGRAGPYWGTAILIVGVAVARGHLRLARISEITSAARLPVALGVFIVTFWSLAAMRAESRSGALLEAARVGVTLSFLAFASMLDTQSRRTLRYLAWVASVLIVFQALLLVAGAVSDRFGTIVFEPSVGHSLVPFSRRFRGLTNQPMNCGSATLLLIGLVGDLQSQALKRLVVALGMAVIMTTLSFASLVVPVAAASLMPVPRLARLTLIVVVATLALAVLWLNPLHIEVAGHTLFDRAPVSSYYEDGLGPQNMPVHIFVAPGLRFDFHVTFYALLAARGVSCALEHPLGVGGRNFILACPVWVMSNYGGWWNQHSAHNAYGSLLAEGGLLTTIATLAFVAWFAKSHEFRLERRLSVAVLLAYLVAANGGASFYQFPFAAVLAISVRRRISPKSRSLIVNQDKM